MFLTFFLNFWRILGKLWEARSRLAGWLVGRTIFKNWRYRSRLHRSRILQVNTKYSLENSWRDRQYSHTFAPRRLQKFSWISSKTFRMFAGFLSEVHWLFAIVQLLSWKIHNFWWHISGIISAILNEFFRKSLETFKIKIGLNNLDSQISWDFASEIVKLFRS